MTDFEQTEISKKKKWGKIIGIGFWPVVIGILAICLLIPSINEFIDFINPTQETVVVNFYKYKDGKLSEETENSVTIKPNSTVSEGIDEGTYKVNVVNENNEIIRTIDKFEVIQDDNYITYFDVAGKNNYIALDASYLYEGNEVKEDNYFELFDGSNSFKVIFEGDCEHINPFKKIPEKLDDGCTLYMLIPILKETELEDEDDFYSFIDDYIAQKIDNTLENN